MTPPSPRPKSARHPMRTWKAPEKYRRIAGVSAHWFDTTTKKVTSNTYKNSPLVHKRTGHQPTKNSQLNKGSISLTQKNCIAVLR
jgi:hypothetical protein